MLGTAPQIVEKYVNTGQVKTIFWPVLNYGNPSLNSTLTAECVGQQNPDAFWQIHELLFTNQRDLWGADRAYFVNAAVSVGADQATFEACYDGTEALATVTALDNLRRQRGIFNQPVFDINGQILAGSQPFSTFDAVIGASLP